MSLLARIVEAYVGEYASGKSEVAINRAISLAKTGNTTLVDLDLVEPFYTLRPLKRRLTELGLNVIAWETKETIGLGEAGSTFKPEMRWVLMRPENVVLDVGYGVDGAKVLNLVEGSLDAIRSGELKILAVLNVGRPMTSSKEEIIEYVRSLGPVYGLINNSHLGEETTIDFVQKGARIIHEAAQELNLPVVASYFERSLKEKLDGETDCMGAPALVLNRFMQDSFW